MPKTFLINSTTNVSGYKARKVKYRGQDRIAVPVALIREGVHNGSQGPVFYSKEEITKFPMAWNGLPVPMDHPTTATGTFCSCNTPSMIEKRSVGRLWGCKAEGDRLMGELWLNSEKLKELSPATFGKIEKGEPIEVSTGMLSDFKDPGGVWNSEEFDKEAVNIHGDHLAILTNSKGACSVKDGCGIRANQSGSSDPKVVNADNVVGVDGEKAVDDVRDQLYNYVRSLRTPDDDSYMPHLRDVFPSYFVFVDTGENVMEDDYFMQGYSVDGNGDVVIADSPVQVDFVSKYTRKQEVDGMEKKVEKDCPECNKIIEGLVANKDSTFEDKDKVWLVKIPLESLKKLDTFGTNAAAPIADVVGGAGVINPVVTKTEKVEVVPSGNVVDNAATNTEIKADTGKLSVVSLEQLPAELQALVRHDKVIEDEAIVGYVAAITANAKNQLTEEQLKGMPVEALKNMAALMPVVANFSGANGMVMPGTKGVEPMGLPICNFEDAKKTA